MFGNHFNVRDIMTDAVRGTGNTYLSIVSMTMLDYATLFHCYII